LRVGDYRVVFKIVKEEIWILAIIHRKDVYLTHLPLMQLSKPVPPRSLKYVKTKKVLADNNTKEFDAGSVITGKDFS